jgi:non-heme chloroperoxidase
MTRIETRDGTKLFYRDWGHGDAVVFVASQALPGDIWNFNVPPLVESGRRCITFDRRGHGRSDEPGQGYDIDTLADDLRAVLTGLDLHDVTLVGHSLGGAEVIRYLGKYHDDRRVRRAVLIAPTAPWMTKAADNPQGLEPAVFEALRAEWTRDFPRWVADNKRAFLTPETSEALASWAERLMVALPLHLLLQVSKTTANTDLRADLRAIRVPTLVLHGDLDASVPVAFGKATADLIPGARFKLYEGAAHGLFLTHAARVHRDVLEFVQGT